MTEVDAALEVTMELPTDDVLEADEIVEVDVNVALLLAVLEELASVDEELVDARLED